MRDLSVGCVCVNEERKKEGLDHENGWARSQCSRTYEELFRNGCFRLSGYSLYSRFVHIDLEREKRIILAQIARLGRSVVVLILVFTRNVCFNIIELILSITVLDNSGFRMIPFYLSVH